MCGVLLLGVSFVSWIVIMSMLCCFVSCVSSRILFDMPLELSWSRLSVLDVLFLVGWVCVG